MIFLLLILCGVFSLALRRRGRDVHPWLLAAIAAWTLSCSVASPTIISTPRPTAAPAVSVVNYSQWPLVLKDDFSQPDNDWETGQSNDRFSTGTVSITGSKYRFDLKANDGFIWWSRSLNNTETTDFYAAVDGQQSKGPDSADYGIVFRWSHGNYYYFQVSNAGKYAFSLNYLEKWITLTDWTKTSAIQPGGVNRLAVAAQGSHFVFFINDHSVGEADDTRLSSGTVGVAVEINQAGDKALFDFDHFEWRAPKGSVISVTPTPAP
jgi:hypothetical protein